MTVAIIIILIITIAGLMVWNLNIHKKIQNYNNINQKVVGLNVLQSFMDTIGEYSSVDEKIQKINTVLIEKYEIKYSTIVIFNGAEYEIKATNVDEKHWGTLCHLHEEDIFKDSITSMMPKYVTVNKESERLPYQKTEFGRAKSAIFFPLFIENVYIGYWIIESGEMGAFDTMDTAILEVVKDNIVAVYKTISYQNVVENTVREDKFSGLYSAEFLYGKAKKQIDMNTTSAVCMFKIVNIEEINEKFGREMGNDIIAEMSQYIKSSISDSYIFVRYMGPKFVIVFSGVDTDAASEFLIDLKTNIEEMQFCNESEEEEKIKKSKNQKIFYASPKLNFVTTTYYKGTALESVTKKLEEYLNDADRGESDINNI